MFLVIKKQSPTYSIQIIPCLQKASKEDEWKDLFHLMDILISIYKYVYFWMNYRIFHLCGS